LQKRFGSERNSASTILKFTMKTLATLLAIAFSAISLTAYGDATLTVEGVHNCCKKCEKGITAAVTSVPGATAAITKTSVTITAKSDADAKKAAEALGAAGYFGTGIDAPAPAASAPAKSATVEGLHLCCQKCADNINTAVLHVAGVTTSGAVKTSKSFTVEGDFSPADLQAALLKAGFTCTIK
jgi:copper chaperone CopZ